MKIRDIPQSGSQGNIVSYKTRYGLVRRRKVTPKDPRTPVQVERREAFQRARAFWGTLTDEQRLAWHRTAAGRRTRAVLNQSGPLSGYLLCVKINYNLAVLGLPMMAEPAPAPTFDADPVEKLVITGTADAIALKLKLSGKPVQYTIVLAAKPQPPGVSYVDHFTIIGLLPDPNRGLSEITGLFVEKYGAPKPGTRIFIRTIQQINGWRGRPKQFSALVPAA